MAETVFIPRVLLSMMDYCIAVWTIALSISHNNNSAPSNTS